MTNDPIDSKCEYRLLENGVHELTVKSFTIAGTDAFIEQLERIYKTHTKSDGMLYILFNGGVGALPITYSLQRGKDLVSRYPDVGEIRVATLSDSAVEVHLVDSFLRLIRFPGMRMRFFARNHREQALEWLLAQ